MTLVITIIMMVKMVKIVMVMTAPTMMKEQPSGECKNFRALKKFAGRPDLFVSDQDDCCENGHNDDEDYVKEYDDNDDDADESRTALVSR